MYHVHFYRPAWYAMFLGQINGDWRTEITTIVPTRKLAEEIRHELLGMRLGVVRVEFCPC